MKKAILTAVLYTILGILFTVAFFAVMTFCLAIPDILEWLSGYIGETAIWIICISSIGFIAYCTNSK